MPIEISKWAFLYGDSEYFTWFNDRIKGNLKKVISWKRLRAETPDINCIWDDRETNVIDAATRDYSVTVKAFLCHLREPTTFPIVDTNVFTAMKELEGAPHKEEWLRLIESVDNYRDKLIVKLLYSTGMRVRELAKLKVEDIDFQERFIHIPAESTK